MPLSLVFPGQGSQAVGMGKVFAEAFASARAVFEEVDSALSQNLSRLMWDGPEDQLTLTENAQPAIMAASLAVMRVLEKDGGFALAARAGFVAGHSLGEYSALCAAGTFSLADAARLLKTRGRAMQRAVPVGEGAMAALLGTTFEQAEDVAKEAATAREVCVVANDNAPGQVVLSGHRPAVERAAEIAKAKGIKRAIMLPVSAPFHCPLMAPAAREMENALGQVEMRAPRVPLIANVTARHTQDADEIRRLLVEQVTGMVRWRETVESMPALGTDRMVELGADVLSGMAKRTTKDLLPVPLKTPADVEMFLKSL